MTVVFKRINKDQALLGAAIIVEAYSAEPWHEHWSIERATARMVELSTTPGWMGVGALDGDDLHGFAIGYPHTAATGCMLYIPEIAVMPAHQGKGIGTTLLKLLEQEALASGFSGTWLLSQNEGVAADYYRSASYKQSPNHRIYSKPLK
ncbi:GNAT family N-acetyltransferase [Rhizobium sp. 21-4511-3d]